MTYTVIERDGQAVAVESIDGLLSSFQASDAAAKINAYGYRSSYICVGYGTDMAIEVYADHFVGDEIVSTCILSYRSFKQRQEEVNAQLYKINCAAHLYVTHGNPDARVTLDNELYAAGLRLTLTTHPTKDNTMIHDPNSKVTALMQTINRQIREYLEDPTALKYDAILEAIEATAKDNPSSGNAYEPTTTVYGYTVKVIDNTATIVNGGNLAFAPAATLCEMINSHIADDVVLKYVESDVIEVEYFDAGNNEYMYRTFTVDPDGYVTDTTITEEYTEEDESIDIVLTDC